MEHYEIDAYVPAQMAERVEKAGVAKGNRDFFSTFTLAVMAGFFIGLGGAFFTYVIHDSMLSTGLTKLIGGFVFSLGLILVIITGAELFTGNNLIVMAWASGKVSTASLLRNWTIVFFGNFVGSILTVILVFASQQYLFANGAVGQTALGIANSKVQLGFIQAIALGVLCNMLVCLAIWLTLSARSTIDKIAAIIFPITAFVAAGFEHSIANMYFIPMGLLIKNFDPAFAAAAQIDLSGLTWVTFLVDNLLPVTIGNIIGGSVGVAAVYWSIFLRRKPS